MRIFQVWVCLTGITVFFGTAAYAEGQPVPAPVLRTHYGVFDPQVGRLPDLVERLENPVAARAVKIVQFVGPIQPAWRRLLAERGLPIRGYIPDHALLVQATPQDLAWLARLPVVRAVIDEPRLWRLDPRLIRSDSDGLHIRPHDVSDVTVELADEGAKLDVLHVIQAAGGSLRDTGPDGGLPLGRVLHVQLPAAALSALAGHPDVAAIEPFVAVRAFNDTSYGLMQAAVRHQAPLWQHGVHGEGQIVGVCDVGVNTNSCFFPSEKIIQYENITPNTEHDQSHGTHVAGSIAGDQFGNGVYDLDDGMAPAANLYIQDAGTAVTGELSVPADLSALFANPYAAGVRIHSDSWGGEDNTYSARERTLDAFVASHRDFLVVVAVGNNGDGPGTVGSPATAKNVLAVGAMDAGAIDDVVAFSAHGPTADGRIKPTVVAPGVQVVSANSQVSCGTTTLSGTSMATPLTAGVAALVRQYYVDGYYPSGVAQANGSIMPSAALIKATILAGTDDMTGVETDGAIPSNGQGFGRVHLANALHFTGDDTVLWAYDDLDGLHQGQVYTATLTTNGGPLHIALTWMDEPANAAAAAVLVNNLDLQVRGPDGSVYWGNNLVAGASQPGGSPDKVNVEEIVVLPEAAPGDYVVSVRAINVPLGPQPYAVVASGAHGGNGEIVNGAAMDGSASGGATATNHANGPRNGCSAVSDLPVWSAMLGLCLVMRRMRHMR